MRIPYAMRTLLGEIEQSHPKAKVETKDPDGFGVWRTLAIDEGTTKDLVDLLDVIVDPRIKGKDIVDGRYHVYFVADHRADTASAYGLDRGYRVLRAEDAPIEEVEIIEETPEAEARRKELNSIAVADLREQYGYADEVKKREVVTRILAAEGFLD